MTYPISSRKFQFVTPPRAYNPTGPQGQEVAVPVSTTAQYLNLQALTFQQPYDARYAQTNNTGFPGQQQGVTDCYVTIYADGADIGVIVGPTAASVSGGAAPSLSAVGSVSPTGAYAGATGACHRIPNGSERRYLMQRAGNQATGTNTGDLYLGFVSSGTPAATGTMRLYQSSPPSTAV